MINIPVSYGELVDKLTILTIKLEHIPDLSKLENIATEYKLLKEKYDSIQNITEIIDLYSQLEVINRKIWKIEDDIRDCERRKDFSETFIQLARSVYLNNDERARIKRKINDALSSSIVEEKSYAEY